MQGMKKTLVKLHNWKLKAKTYRLERDASRKRIKELTTSRDKWKKKYMEYRKVDKNMAVSRSSLSSDKPARHSYSSDLISLTLLLRHAHCSLSSCLEILRILVVFLGLELRIPSRSSIQNWEKKLGYWRLYHREVIDANWLIILDESISVGSQKLLVVLGLNLKNYTFGHALKLEEVEVLLVRISDSWKGEAISEELTWLKEQGYSISYAVSDGGTNLCKGLRMSGITQVRDCTHAIGNLLKKQYQKEEQFNNFIKECGLFKRQVMLGKQALVMPPNQRVKGRFLNLQPLSEWGCKLLWIIENKPESLSEQTIEKLDWLLKYKPLLTQINEQCQTMKVIFKVLKNRGLSQQTAQECEQLLQQSKANAFFQEGVKKYLQDNLKLLGNDTCRICCSDSIESLFGKYKNQLSNTSSQVITDSSLTIANLVGKPKIQEVKKAMEGTKIIHLKQWAEENLPESLIKKRRKLFKNAG